jgi:hypothetical protein
VSLGLRPLGLNPLGLLDTPAAADVTVALTGVAATGSVGTLLPSTVVGLTGTSATGSVGTLFPALSVPITGVEATGQIGTLLGEQEVSVALSGVSSTGAVGTLLPALSVGLAGVSATGHAGTITPEGGAATTDTHDGDTWRRYRKSLRNLAKLAEERRRAKDAEAGEVRLEILAVLEEAKDVPAVEVREAVAEIRDALPGTSERQIRRVDDWSPILRAVERLEAALAYERMLDEDDEEVLLLI